jgi:hypothetical protein
VAQLGREVELMAKFNHPNIVKVGGVACVHALVRCDGEERVLQFGLVAPSRCRCANLVLGTLPERVRMRSSSAGTPIRCACAELTRMHACCHSQAQNAHIAHRGHLHARRPCRMAVVACRHGSAVLVRRFAPPFR